jgi:UDP-2,3-diacylglucosamine hydrolase
MGKIFFASDFHLGVDAQTDTKLREKQIIRWLDAIADQADALFLVGDLFDFWFEYKTVVPKGHVRLLGKLAELSDSGIPIHFFTGNHDMWIFSYFEQELGIKTYRKPEVFDLQGKRCFIGHGDGLGPGDYGYKVLKKVFENKVCQWLFERIHPNTGIGIAEFWSGRSRYANKNLDQYKTKEEEWLYQYCESQLSSQLLDYFVFGHRHIPIFLTLSDQRTVYCNLGEWMYSRSFGIMEGGVLSLAFFENENGKIHTV